MNEKILKLLTDLNINYLSPEVTILGIGEPIYLGNEDEGKCRFCKKSTPEVSFNKIAHAIPEFVGNKQLFSYYECDSCNSKFARLVETHMGDYMNIHNAVSQVKGKRGVPSYKQGGKKSRIDMTTEGLRFQSFAEDSSEIFTIDEEAKTITIEGVRATYVPVAVFKCLCKMALAIMDEKELAHFSHTLEWILEESHSESRFKLSNAIAAMTFSPGAMPFDFTRCYLLKRKADHSDNVPYMIFMLEYGNYTFQIPLPLCTEDKKLEGLPASMIYIPSSVEINDNVFFKRKVLDLNSSTKVKGEEVKLTMGFELMETTFYDPTLEDKPED